MKFNLFYNQSNRLLLFDIDRLLQLITHSVHPSPTHSRCGHCQRLAPTWTELAELLNTKEGTRVKIGKVDCTQQNELCSSHEVTGYPTLKFFKLGQEESIKFRGTRDLPTLTNFINEQLGEVPEVSTAAVFY